MLNTNLIMATVQKPTLGRRIRDKRKAAGFSQAEFAEKLGISHQAISFWESDETAPRNARLEQIAELLQTSKAWLMFGDAPSEALVLTHTDQGGQKIEIPLELYHSAQRALEGYLFDNDLTMKDKRKNETVLLLCQIELQKQTPSDKIEIEDHKPLLKLVSG